MGIFIKKKIRFYANFRKISILVKISISVKFSKDFNFGQNFRKISKNSDFSQIFEKISILVKIFEKFAKNLHTLKFH